MRSLGSPASLVVLCMYIQIKIFFTDKIEINIDLLLAADKYNIPDLIRICANHLKTNLTEGNAVEIMTKSYMINQKDLFDAAQKFVQFCKNTGKVVDMEALEDLKETNPTLALKMLSQAMFHTGNSGMDAMSKESIETFEYFAQSNPAKAEELMGKITEVTNLTERALLYEAFDQSRKSDPNQTFNVTHAIEWILQFSENSGNIESKKPRFFVC